MSLHPVLAEKLTAALQAVDTAGLTRRDVSAPPMLGKAQAVNRLCEPPPGPPSAGSRCQPTPDFSVVSRRSIFGSFGTETAESLGDIDMPRPAEQPEREERIRNEIVVDAYDETERASSWYCHLEDRLSFPLRAQCIAHRATSPLRRDEMVEVIDLADEGECGHEMFVTIQWRDLELAVPLAQLQPVAVDEETAEAVGDWHYWMARGYEF